MYFLSLRMLSNLRPVLTLSISLEFKSVDASTLEWAKAQVQLPDVTYSSVLYLPVMLEDIVNVFLKRKA